MSAILENNKKMILKFTPLDLLTQTDLETNNV